MIELIRSSTWLCIGTAIAFVILSVGTISALDFSVKEFWSRKGRRCTTCNGLKMISWDKRAGKYKAVLLESEVPCPECNGVGRIY